MKIPNILIGLQDIKRECSWIAQILFLLRRLTQIGCCLTVTALAESPETSRYPGASHVPDSQPGWEAFVTKVDPNAAKDEPQGGRTAQGTPVEKRIEECFPAEPRNLFWEVDKVASGPGGALERLNYDVNGDGKISDQERDAIRGQNTWMLWGEGNETFWDWLQEHGYGLADFLVLLDSRQRDHRFRDSGLMNQPGMKKQTDRGKRILGLYLDQADGDQIRLKQPPEGEFDGNGKPLVHPPQAPPGHPQQIFKPGDKELYDKVLAQLPKDGVDYSIYGYPSGIIGLRLMPNPDFFGDTPAAAMARAYWKQRVEDSSNDAYYTDTNTNADPKLIRPFRPSMACAFCHIGPHPLNAPADPENPQWENLSSIIGNQYWTPKTGFANLLKANNFLHHIIASQQPGTIDTSLVSTDHINNPNTINAIFEIPERLERAAENPPENQSAANLLMTSVEDGNSATNPRHIPRVLLDGADSIGIFGALSRVYLNIGTFSEEWRRCHNPIVGFRPQKPFSIAACEANSVFWRAAEKYRIRYLQAFFTLKSGRAPDKEHLPPDSDAPSNVPVQNESTAPMKLVFAGPEGKAIIEQEKEQALAGRKVFLENCAICHSSKQPEGFQLNFSLNWAKQADVPSDSGNPAHFTLPMSFADWELFRKSQAFKEYGRRIAAIAGQPENGEDAFIKGNYLSTDIRVPITLVGTNSGRAVATNAMRGQVWDNFSSEDYKSLPAVGPVRFYNPYSGVQPDSMGMNDAYYPPGGGPGYYRPASLVSLWATAPYLHNNALGLYNQDPSVRGRLAAFADGITKLLWNSKRVPDRNHVMGDLRWDHEELTKGDPGFIYRTPEETYVSIPGKFIEPLIAGIIGSFWTSFLSLYLWILLFALLALLAWWSAPRMAALVFLLLGLIIAAAIVITRFDRVYWLLWLLPVILLGGALWFWLSGPKPLIARISLGIFALLSLFAGFAANRFITGGFGPLQVGPIPQGTPVNLIANMNPEAPFDVLLNAETALLRGALMVKAHHLKGEPALRTFEREAGLPLLKASKCPDFVLDRGHWFGEALSDDEKQQLIVFLKTL
ncbi:MAG TPA: cytochrome c [Chthoniobacterales bacterium]|nr:cytochrome c [Chthoniobacterales bacterium]